MAALDHFDTHEVTNQSPPYVDVDLYASDRPLQDAVAANGGGAETQALSAFGRHWGTAAMLELARQANENPPQLKTFDAKGFRREWSSSIRPTTRFMAESIAAGCKPRPGAMMAMPAPAPAQGRARGALLHGGAGRDRPSLPDHHDARRGGGACGRAGALAELMPKICRAATTPRFRPWWEKTGITLGMGMTEKQGGTDVRANTTTARPPAGDGYRHHRPQMVHVRAHVRRLPGAGAGAGRAHLLPDAALSPRRLGQRAAPAAPEGQARQPLECVVRSRVRRRLRLARRRGGQGRAHHHPDGAADAARLRHRLGRASCAWRWRRRCITRAIAPCSRSASPISR